MEAGMTHVTGRIGRISLGMLAAAILTAGFCGEAAAKVHKARWHAPSSVYESRAQLVSPSPTPARPMRYYGGPKSPMWR
jgi:hypothetical protein